MPVPPPPNTPRRPFLEKLLGRWQELRASLTPHTLLGHMSNAFHLAAYVAQDLLSLRVLGIVGTGLGVVYNFGHKTGTLWIPVAWGVVFAVFNGYRIVQLMLQDSVTFTDEALEVFDEVFAPHQFTPRQYFTLLQLAKTRVADPWEVVTVQGAHAPPELIVVTDGEAVATHTTATGSGAASPRPSNKPPSRLITHAVSRGSLIGDAAFSRSGGVAAAGAADDLDADLKAAGLGDAGGVDGSADGAGGVRMVNGVPVHGYTVRAGEHGLKMMVLPAQALREAMRNDPLLALAINRLLHRHLSAEYSAVLRQTRRHHPAVHTYQRMLECTCVDDTVPAASKQILRRFRLAHGITPEEHAACLRRIGWTLEDFDDGGRGAPLAAALSVALQTLRARGVLLTGRDDDEEEEEQQQQQQQQEEEEQEEEDQERQHEAGGGKGRDGEGGVEPRGTQGGQPPPAGMELLLPAPGVPR